MGIYSIFTLDAPIGIILLILCAYLLALLFSIVSHEFSHAFVAFKMGDSTAKLAGRMSFNPVRHFEPIGMLCLALFGFGWAKGVPVNPNNFTNYKKGQIAVSLAGVCTNLILGVVFTFLSVVVDRFLDSTITIVLFLQYLFAFIAMTNYVLAVFNILPIYPLDGFSFLEAFLPYDNKFVVFMKKYGIIILIVLLISQLIPLLMTQVVNLFYYDLYGLFAQIFG